MKRVVKQKAQTRTGFGVASLIMILLVLCLALMGVLSLMSARSDQALSRRYAHLSSGYAQAAAQAQRALAELDAALWAVRLDVLDETAYGERCMDVSLSGSAQISWMDGQSATLYIDAGEERRIEVQIKRADWESAPQKRFSVTAHRLVDTKEWKETDGLTLMGM